MGRIKLECPIDLCAAGSWHLSAAAARDALRSQRGSQGEFAYDASCPFRSGTHTIVRDLVLLPDHGRGEQTTTMSAATFIPLHGARPPPAGLMGAIDTRAQAGRYLEGLSLVDEARFSEEALASQMSVIENCSG